MKIIGADIISRVVSATNKTDFYLYDGHGSVRGTTDVMGQITDTFGYDAYGVAMKSGYDAEQPQNIVNAPKTSLGYAGEQHDATLGMSYNRARYYDYSTGVWNRLDPFVGRKFDPQSLHKYVYCHDDPVNGLDPSGEMTLTELMTTTFNTLNNFLQFATKVLNVYNKVQTFVDILQTIDQIRSGGLNKLIADELKKLAANALLGGNAKLLRIRIDTILEILQNVLADLTRIVAAVVKVHSKRLFEAFGSTKLTRSKRDRLVIYGPTLGGFYRTHKRLVKVPGVKIGKFKTVMTIGGRGARLFGIGFSKAREKKKAYQILRIDWHDTDYRHSPSYSRYFKVNGDEFHWQTPENTSDARR